MNSDELIQDLTRRLDIAIAELDLSQSKSRDLAERAELTGKVEGLRAAKSMLSTYTEEPVEEIEIPTTHPTDCLASLYDGIPMYIGAHKSHLFYYGPGEKYTGHCGGRGEHLELV